MAPAKAKLDVVAVGDQVGSGTEPLESDRFEFAHRQSSEDDESGSGHESNESSVNGQVRGSVLRGFSRDSAIIRGTNSSEWAISLFTGAVDRILEDRPRSARCDQRVSKEKKNGGK